MVRKQVYLTAEQNERLRREASRQRRSEAEILREALDHHLRGRAAGSTSPGDDPLWDVVGIDASDEDLSERVDDVLYGAGGA